MERMPSVMSHNFSQVPAVEIQRSSFDRSHGLKTTFDASRLIPIFLDEVLPGDTFNLSMSGFGRLATPLVPLMDNLFLETFFFFVPNRLVWSNWQKFCGEQVDPGDSTDYVIPTLTWTGNIAQASVADYFGLPIGKQPTNVSCLPFRAYNLIYNEWFRDQNLQDSVVISTGDGPDAGTTLGTNMRKRGKKHDYFTSCLPWPQKGDSVDLPIGSSADIKYGSAIAGTSYSDTFVVYSQTNAGTGEADWKRGATAGVDSGILATGSTGNLYADLSTATAATINQLRQAFQIQRLYERDARGGTRYIEILKAHFGVTAPDFRLQRPEYLGGGSSPIFINPVAQTSETLTTALGTLAGVGTVAFNNHGFTKSFTEHGYIIGLANVRADITYQQGLNRMWSRSTRWDFYWPALAHIGEQAVLSKEIYYGGVAADDDVFGYQERFAEYRYKPSIITGLFRSDAAGTLDFWHLSQDFSTRPTLNSTFIEDATPLDRCIAVPSEPHIILDAYFKLHCTRPMPVYSVPGLIDHF